jgi:peptidoglycan/LPS O-acetylase OafA/YrhL
MFFALSGYLIGRILLEMQSDGFSRQLVLRFLARRWLRTLPVYYAFLLLTVAIWPKVAATLPDFLIMGQSFFHPIAQPNEFPQSWSLPIEEISYIVLPLAALIFSTNRRALFLVVLGLIAWSMLFRAFWTGAYNFLLMRTLTAARLDAIVYGLLGAAFSRRCSSFYRRHQSTFLTVAAAIIAYHALRFCDTDNLQGLYWRVFSLPVFSIAVSAILPALSDDDFGWPRLRRFLRFTSDRAYTLYVVHIFVAATINVTLHKLPLGLLAGIYVLASYSVAGIFSLAIERPFLRLRPSQVPCGYRHAPS